MSSSGRLTNDPWRGPRRRRTILALAGLALLGSCEDCGAGGEDSFPDTWDSGDGTADEECTPCPCWAVACMDLSDDLEVFGLYDLDGGHDASGDGELDVVVGAYAADGSSEHGGTAYLFSGPLEGHYESSEMDASFTLDRLQRLVHVEMLGDMDGDGVAEVAFLNAYSGDGAYQAEVAVLLGPWTSAETVAGDS